MPRTIWEPAAGRGAIVRELRSAGHVLIASDLVARDFPLNFVSDFLTTTAAPAGCKAIVTNPPYDRRILNRFVAHALDLCPRVALLMRLSFLEGMARSDILERGARARLPRSAADDASRRLDRTPGQQRRSRTPGLPGSAIATDRP